MTRQWRFVTVYLITRVDLAQRRQSRSAARSGLGLPTKPAPATKPADDHYPERATGLGAITPEKKRYDDWTAEHFRSGGLQAFVIDRRGRFADVLAIRGDSLAIIEVKSPKESSASPRWDDSRHLSAALEGRYGAHLRAGAARKRACAVLPGHRPSSAVCLYAMTIAAQLSRYYFEFGELASQYERAIPTRPKLIGVQFSKLPFLVVPAERACELRTATEALAAHGIVVSPRFETTPRLAMSSFSYPDAGSF